MIRENDDKIDQLEAALFNEGNPVDMPVQDLFVPGMYIRTIYMPKGEEGEENIVTSLVHNTEHPFFVMAGKVAVFSDNDGEQIIEAPYFGITKPGTRRVLRIIEDTVWITCHPTDIKPEDDTEEGIQEAVSRVKEQIIEPHINRLLGSEVFRNKLSIEKETTELIN